MMLFVVVRFCFPISSIATQTKQRFILFKYYSIDIFYLKEKKIDKKKRRKTFAKPTSSVINYVMHTHLLLLFPETHTTPTKKKRMKQTHIQNTHIKYVRADRQQKKRKERKKWNACCFCCMYRKNDTVATHSHHQTTKRKGNKWQTKRIAQRHTYRNDDTQEDTHTYANEFRWRDTPETHMYIITV